MKRKLQSVVVLVALAASAQAVDQKSLLLGVGIGLGVYTVQKGVVPAIAAVGHGTKAMARGTKRVAKRAILGPKKAKR